MKRLPRTGLDGSNQLLVTIIRQAGIDDEKCMDHARDPKAQ